jgi:uncharacterized protein involved in type VI secretion and phage assembly
MDMVATVLASLAAPGQHDRLLRLHTPLGGERLVAERFGGIERIDEVGFRLEVTALSTDAALPLDALLGKPVLLELLAATGWWSSRGSRCSASAWTATFSTT